MYRKYFGCLCHRLPYSLWYPRAVDRGLRLYIQTLALPTMANPRQCLPILSNLTLRSIPSGSKTRLIQTQGHSPSIRYVPCSLLHSFSPNQSSSAVRAPLSGILSSRMKRSACVINDVYSPGHTTRYKLYLFHLILTDLSKAFDCLPYDLLVTKMYAYGLSQVSCKPIASYLNMLKDKKYPRVKIVTGNAPCLCNVRTMRTQMSWRLSVIYFIMLTTIQPAVMVLLFRRYCTN